jgi:F-type H+-transporting ATPase subunit alpha
MQDEFDDFSTEFGSVISIKDGVVQIVGLPSLKLGEKVLIGPAEVPAMVLNLESRVSKAVIFGDDSAVNEGDEVYGTGTSIAIGVDGSLIGRVIDPLGNPLDDLPEFSEFSELFPIDIKAPGIMPRKSVHEPMPTGIKIIDSMLPIGNGQRELIIGDRQTGKTSIALDTIINQQNNELDMVSIYVGIGQKKSSTAFLVEKLNAYNSMNYSIVILAGASDSSALQFLAPYSGCTIGEWFRDSGMNALIIYDDLSKHAVAYRQISLLLRRPPSREAYPGDIFYLHSRLLERAAKLNSNYGSGSLTALPIIETLSGDLSAYIPTNVISITDGQIFLDDQLFKGGIRPAVNLNLSVSRVGSAAQTPLMKTISGNLKFYLASYNELKVFNTFSSDIDIMTLTILNRGARLVELLKQPNYSPMLMDEQFVILFAGLTGLLDNIPLNKISEVEQVILSNYRLYEFYNEDSSISEIKKELTSSLVELIDSIQFNK